MDLESGGVHLLRQQGLIMVGVTFKLLELAVGLRSRYSRWSITDAADSNNPIKLSKDNIDLEQIQLLNSEGVDQT